MARPSPGVRRVAAVLEFMAAQPDRRFTLSELSRGCNLNKATAHSLLGELSAAGILLRHPEEKRYSLGPRLVSIGSAAEQGYQGRDFRDGPLRRLAAASGGAAVALAPAPAGRVRVIDHVGVPARSPLPAEWVLLPPLGAVFFAWAERCDVEAWLARSPGPDALTHALQAVAAVRRSGACVGLAVPAWRALLRRAALDHRTGRGTGASFDDRRRLSADLARARPVVTAIEPGRTYDVGYVAAPVFDAAGTVSLALATGWVRGHRCDAGRLVDLRDRVIAAADEITAAICGRRPDAGGVPRAELHEGGSTR